MTYAFGATNPYVTITGNTVQNLKCAGTQVGYNNGGSLSGIVFGLGNNGIVSGNTIHDLSSTATGTGNYAVNGIFLSSANANNTRISKNVIYNLSNAGTGTAVNAPPLVAGIYVYNQGTSDTIDNNMISLGNAQTTNTTFAGLLLYNAPAHYVYNNTVNITGTVTSGALASMCLNRGNLANSYTGTVDIRNNIFTNTRTGGTGKHYAITNAYNIAGVTGWGANSSNYNVLNAASGTVGYWGATSTAQAFSAWQSISAGDGSSLSGITVTYVNSASDLHLNMGTTPTALESGGTNISASVSTDIDGQQRPGPVASVNGGAIAYDLGADEFDGVPLDVVAPVISYTALTNTASTANRATTSFATITDAVSGVATASGSRPRLYYKLSTDNNTFGGNTSTDNGWKWVAATGTASPFNFTIDYSIINGGTVSAGNTIQYFVAAQDLAATPNVGANPSAGFAGTSVSNITSAPSSPNSYAIVAASLSTAISVGTGQAYTSLTGSAGLFNAINTSGLSGNTTVNITSDLSEDGTTALTSAGMNGYTVTIQPDAATLHIINASGNLSTAMLRFDGASNATVDGRSGGSGQYLQIVNTNTTPASCQPAVTVLNGATGITIRNCIIETNASVTTTATVLMGAGANTLVLAGNDIRAAVGTPGTAGVPANAIYSNNVLNSITVGGSTAADGNNIYDFTNYGVGMVSIANSAVIRYNNLYQTAGRGSIYFIYVNVGSYHNISNNNIYQTGAANTSTVYGIIIAGSGSGFVVSNNSIGGSTPTRSGSAMAMGNNVYGIYIQANGYSAYNTISSNTISNITTTGVTNGILCYGNVNITGNIIGGGSAASDTIQSGNTINMVSYAGTGTANIFGNTISNGAVYSAFPVEGIYFSGTYATVNIRNNQIHDLKSNTTTGPWETGIYSGSALTSASVIDSNSIYNLISSYTGTTTLAVVVGMYFNSALNGAVISRNKIYGLQTYSPATGVIGPNTIGIYMLANANNGVFVNNQISLGSVTGPDCVVLGICDFANGNNKYEYNNIEVTGSMTGNNDSYCYYFNASGRPLLRNNVLYNGRTTTGTGGQYAIGLNATTWTSASSNYNLFVVPTLANTCLYGTGVPQTLAAWQAAGHGDANSSVQTTTTLPASSFFTADASADLSTASAYQSYVRSKATPVTEVTTDYSATSRSGTKPSIGAFEYLPITWNGNGTTWTTGSNWTGGATPGSADSLVIPGGLANYPILTTTQSLGSISIQSGGSVTLNGGDLQVNGTFINNGTVSGSNKISLNGSSAQTIAGTTGTTSNLELNNSAGATITAANKLNITGTLTSTSGALTTNGGLYLKSISNTSTGRIAAGSGSISGNVNIERYVPGQRGYAMMGHPYTSNIDLSQLSAYLDITGISGGSTCQGTSPSVFTYTPGAGAYVGVTNGAGAFPAAAAGATHPNGLLVFLRGAKGEGCNTRNSYTPSVVTFTTTAPVNQGTITQTVPANGWNMISNPYPSQIVLSGITVSGGTIDAYKTVNPAGQFINVYTNGTAYADAPTTTVIPINGAFLAHNSSTTNDAVLTFTEATAETSAAPATTLFKTTSLYPTLELGMSYGGNMWDNWRLQMKPQTGNAAGDAGDLGKISNAQLDMYSLSADGKQMNLDARDADSIADGAIIALGLRSAPQANYTLTVNENTLPASKVVYLHDKYTNTLVQLTNGASYPVTVDANAASQGDNRLELLFNNVNNTTGVGNVTGAVGHIQIAPNPASNSITLSYPTIFTGGKAITIVNAIGQVVMSVNSSDRIVNVDISALASGIYLVKTTTGDNTATGKFIKY